LGVHKLKHADKVARASEETQIINPASGVQFAKSFARTLQFANKNRKPVARLPVLKFSNCGALPRRRYDLAFL
jgi:hypothetical protein